MCHRISIAICSDKDDALYVLYINFLYVITMHTGYFYRGIIDTMFDGFTQAEVGPPPAQPSTPPARGSPVRPGVPGFGGSTPQQRIAILLVALGILAAVIWVVNAIRSTYVVVVLSTILAAFAAAMVYRKYYKHSVQQDDEPRTDTWKKVDRVDGPLYVHIATGVHSRNRSDTKIDDSGLTADQLVKQLGKYNVYTP